MMIKAEISDNWDWIISDVAERDLRKYKWIEDNCTFYEVAKMYAMRVYDNTIK